MRRFVLYRHTDVSGISGTGVVVEGVEFSDGTAAIRWQSETASTTVWDSVANLLKVHGHNGATVLYYIDGEGVNIERLLGDLYGGLAA
jgi:hypothetical protein